MKDFIKQLKDFELDIKEIKKATSYSDNELIHGSTYDSSSRKDQRMYWVKQALKSNDIKQKVLKKAAIMAEYEFKYNKNLLKSYLNGEL